MGKPLLVGTLNYDRYLSKFILLRENGYYISGRDVNGMCITKDNYGFIYYNNDITLKFLENLIYSCSLSLNQLEFENFCKNKLWRNYVIFNFFSNIDLLGILGNANIKNKDVK